MDWKMVAVLHAMILHSTWDKNTATQASALPGLKFERPMDDCLWHDASCANASEWGELGHAATKPTVEPITRLSDFGNGASRILVPIAHNRKGGLDMEQGKRQPCCHSPRKLQFQVRLVDNDHLPQRRMISASRFVRAW